MGLIGNTPLVKLRQLANEKCADVYIKFEGANPTGNMKDRMALSVINAAVERGDLKSGGTLIEYTGGSTGSSLAMVAALMGYGAHFVSSDAFSLEKLQTMKAYGAELEIIPSERGILNAGIIDRMITRTRELNEELPDAFWVDQLNNKDIVSGYHGMAWEMIEKLGTDIDEFVMAAGSGGCISGNSEVLKKEIPHIKIIAVEPYYVRNVSGGDTSGNHRLEGIGLNFIPSIMRTDLIDEVIPVKDEDAYRAANDLARKEGILGGITSGANIWAALERAKILGPGKKIVTVVIDSGLKYLNGDLFAS